MTPPIRVVVADDDTLVRDGIAVILDGQEQIDVVGRADDGRDTLAQCLTLRPDVVLLDIQMPRMDGLTALAELGRNLPEAAVVMLTVFDSGPYIDEALASGAAGFLLKNSSYEELVAAVRSAYAGNTALSPTVTRRVVDGYLATRRQPDPDDARRIQTLTSREREVLNLVASGAANTDIASSLHLSEHTVKTHVSHILTKTGCTDRAQATALAHRIIRGL